MGGVGLYGRPPRRPCICLPTRSLVQAMWPTRATIKALPRRSTTLATTREPREKRTFTSPWFVSYMGCFLAVEWGMLSGVTNGRTHYSGERCAYFLLTLKRFTRSMYQVSSHLYSCG